MRHSRMLVKQPRKKRKYASIIFVIVLLGAAAYFIGAGAAGGWLAENVINPVFNSGISNAEEVSTDKTNAPETSTNTVSPAPTQTIQAVNLPETSGTQMEENISAKAISLFALQTGAFSEETNAKDAAGEIITKGGAGFLAYDGEFFRVLVAGFTDETEAKDVKTTLESNNITTSIFKLDSGSLEFKIRAEQFQIDAVKACFETIPESVETLQQIGYDADKGVDVNAQISQLKQNINKVTQNLDDVITADEGAMMSLSTYMKEYNEKIKDMPDSSTLSGAEFSSALRYTLIDIVVDYSAFLDEISN